ncbi:MAG: antirestriction protein ArdA [Solirubrobacteraceae bacterium]
MSEQPQPRIYVASLADYNAGRLHGVWLDATEPYPELCARVDRMLAGSATPLAEEAAIHDFEGFGPLRLHEYDPLESVAAIASGIASHGTAFAAWASLLDRCQWESELCKFEDRYLGHYDSLNSWAADVLEECDVQLEDHVPGWLLPHVRIDIEAFASDLAVDYSLVEANDGVWIFDLV